MNFTRIAKFLGDNTPLILSSVAVVGTVSTAILAVRGTREAVHLIWEENDLPNGREVQMTQREELRLTWTCYIPAIAVGGMTIACIVAANTVNTKRQIAMASAFTISEKAFTEYRDKVIEQHGENKERKVREAVEQDTLDRNPVPSKVVFLNDDADQLFFESFTGRYFMSKMETIRQAQNDINARIIEQMYASLNDFFNIIGLESTSAGEELGWTLDNRLEAQFSPMIATNGKVCMNIGYSKVPVRDYFQLGR